MKNNHFCFAIGFLFLFASCKSNVDSVHKNACALAGKYLNYTSLENCPDILPGEVPSFALEIEFTTRDTIDMNNGFERFRLPLTGPGDSCTYTIVGASQFGDMQFMLQGDTIIQLFDSAWTHLSTPSIFRRIDESKPWGFVHYLNECAMVGTYNLIKEGVGKDHKVILLRNGQVDGMKPYLYYELCYAGDCLEETEPHSNTIDLMDDHGNHTTFALKIAPGRRLLQFYNLGDPIPDMKGARKIGSLAFELKQ